MTTLFRSRLMAALVACVALAAPAQAQFNPFNRQAPPADIPGGGDPNQAAELVLRVNQLEQELRQASGRIEELENAEHRLETELQKFRQDVEFRFGDHSEGASRQPDVAEAPASPGEPAAPARPRKPDAFDPDADPNAPGAPRPLGTTPPSAPLAREAPAAPAGQPLELGKAAGRSRARRPRPQADRQSSAPAWRCSISRASSSTPRCKPFKRGNIRRRKPGSSRFSPPIRHTG